jgi:hypothetical protein
MEKVHPENQFFERTFPDWSNDERIRVSKQVDSSDASGRSVTDTPS